MLPSSPLAQPRSGPDVVVSGLTLHTNVMRSRDVDNARTTQDQPRPTPPGRSSYHHVMPSKHRDTSSTILEAIRRAAADAAGYIGEIGITGGIVVFVGVHSDGGSTINLCSDEERRGAYEYTLQSPGGGYGRHYCRPRSRNQGREGAAARGLPEFA